MKTKCSPFGDLSLVVITGNVQVFYYFNGITIPFCAYVCIVLSGLRATQSCDMTTCGLQNCGIVEPLHSNCRMVCLERLARSA